MRPVEDEGGLDEGALIATVDGVDVRESIHAGAYYCAHVWWQLSRHAQDAATSIARDRAGDPLVGFLHVPNDPESVGVVGRSAEERQARTAQLITWTLRGIIDELGAQAVAPVRVLLTGFGPFAAVVNNPSGQLIDDAALVPGAMAFATGMSSRALDPIVEGNATLLRDAAGPLVVGRLRLPVDDAALDHGRVGSLPWAVHKLAPHAVIALGVHRGSNIFRVELLPTNAGLIGDDAAPRHERDRPHDGQAPINRALVRLIQAGAAALSRVG